MQNQELVSIITPLYNSEKYVAETIESVLAQTYENWEMLIIDDCSSDNGPKIVKDYAKKDARIKYHKLESNSGPAVSRNRAIELANGKYIAFLDSDDLWKKEKLEKQIKFMKEKDCAFSFTEYEEISDEGKSLNILIKTPKNPISYRKYLLTTPIGCLTAIYDAKKLGKIYMPLIRKRQDAATWLKILKTGVKAYPLKENLAIYRLRKSSVSSNKINLVKPQWILYREVEKMNYFESLFYLTCTIFTKIFKIKERKIK